jgi:ankyrin repeat protein
MNSVFPRPGQVFRALVTSSGYRRYLAQRNLDKDFDDLANESRPGSVCDLLWKAEKAWFAAIESDCGAEWAQLLQAGWHKALHLMQQLALNVDGSALIGQQHQIQSLFTVPVLSSALRFVADHISGPDIDAWWKSPFAAWVQFAAEVSGVARDVLLENLGNQLEVDPRSIERWIAGDCIGAVSAAYRPTVLAALGKDATERIAPRDIDRLSGWLMCAVATQAQPTKLRHEVGVDSRLRRYQPWSFLEACQAFARLAAVSSDRPIRAQVIPVLQNIETAFIEKLAGTSAIHALLDEFGGLIASETPQWQASYQYIHDWFSARLEAISGNEETALRLYADAVEGVWWFGGQNQHPILNEALLYAVGVGKKVAAEHYWDKVCLVGLNRWPKRPLDEQELRRLAFAFEKMFAPAKAKARIPPAVEVVLQTAPFSLARDQIENPNRKVKHAGGRTRRTPLMDAINEGGLDDVKRLVDAGGDPNDYVSESGEGPLTYAMRRARDRKDPAIMRYLLQLNLSPDTVNRAASTLRETPLKLAIEMADGEAVERLIKLGADIEATCGQLTSALCYAMSSLHESLTLRTGQLADAYFNGKIPGDVYDAKEGAVLDADLVARRRRLLALRDASERNRKMFEGVVNYMVRPPAEYKEVIAVLLRNGANPNRRYQVEPTQLERWTPTLFAAQLGDLDVFEMLVASGGNPELTLTPPQPLAQYDALWIAAAYKRTAIVRFLTERKARDRCT